MSEKLVVTKIEKQQNRRLYDIYLNEEYAITLNENVLISNSLYRGKEMSQDILNDIIINEYQEKAWSKSLKYLSYRDRSENEIIKYLNKLKYPEEVIEIVIKKLKEKGYLNDIKYAINFVNQRITSKPMSKQLLAYELKNKGISSINITHALKEFDEEFEYNMAIMLADKKIDDFELLDWNNTYKKLGNYLQKRGFSYSLILKVLDKYKSNFNNKE